MKRFAVDYSKCSGCRTCEMVCSLRHDGICGPSYSRINIIKWELEGIYAPVVCQQCEERICVSVCPVKAIVQSPSTGLYRRDPKRCIGCLNCMMSCPFGAVSLSSVTGKAQSCDLCEGDPTCVKICPTGALGYEADDRVNRKLREKITDYLIFEGVLKRDE